ANEVVPADRLIDAVWDDDPPETARNVVQSYVSQLRKAIGPDAIQSRGRGYVVEVRPAELDLQQFQQLVAATEGADPSTAADRLRSALKLWRGSPIADIAQSRFASAAADRLEELRLGALERQIDADLASGRDLVLVGELEALVAEHPLRERLRGLLMLALYRSGRQAEALEVFRSAREALIGELGLEPGPPLQELERAILRHDPSLSLERLPTTPPQHVESPASSILVAPGSDATILPLCSIAEPLARRPRREVIVVRLLEDEAETGPATAHLSGLRDELVARGLDMRVAAYTSTSPGEDVVLLAREQDVGLVLVDASTELFGRGLPNERLAAVLRHAPCDVAMLIGRRALRTKPVVVPLGGGEHGWAAVALGAWTARALGTPLLLVGRSADRCRRRRDASRPLGRVSLVVQAAVGIVAEPVLVRGGAAGILTVSADAS